MTNATETLMGQFKNGRCIFCCYGTRMHFPYDVKIGISLQKSSRYQAVTIPCCEQFKGGSICSLSQTTLYYCEESVDYLELLGHDIMSFMCCLSVPFLSFLSY